MISCPLGYGVNERGSYTALHITDNFWDEPFELLAVECYFCFPFCFVLSVSFYFQYLESLCVYVICCISLILFKLAISPIYASTNSSYSVNVWRLFVWQRFAKTVDVLMHGKADELLAARKRREEVGRCIEIWTADVFPFLYVEWVFWCCYCEMRSS